MTCPTPITRNIRSQRFINWARNVEFTTNESYRPNSRGEIVELIRIAEEENLSIKWHGSRWSFMTAFVSNDIAIESENISGLVEINRSSTVPEERKVLSHLTLRPGVDSSRLVHIKGGTKIFNVNRLLHGLDLIPNNVFHAVPDDEFDDNCTENMLAMPTLGGSGGQAIAGAVSTGTHGGDIAFPPIADAVAAIHLIGPGGQEWWIEKSAGITAGSEEDTRLELESLVTRFPDTADELCNDIVVRKNDEFFNSVLVSLGRMGFIYSLVFEVRDRFKLTERRRNDVWETFRDNLTMPPLRDLDSAHPDTDIRVANIHYLNILIMPFSNETGRHVCKIATREIHEGACEELPPNVRIGRENPNFFAGLCRVENTRQLLRILLPVLAALMLAAATLGATIGFLLAIPFVGWALATAAIAALAALSITIAALSGLIAYISVGSRTVREVIGAITDFAFRFGFRELMISVLTSLFDSLYPVTTEEGGPYVRTGFGFKIMDAYGYEGENFCEKVESMDFAFDAFSFDASGRPVYFNFIDAVLNLFDELRSRNIAIAGNLALRYSRNTSALIGISRFETTVHIEIAVLRDFPGNSEFIERVQTAAKGFNGIPSWGQLFNHYDARDIINIYGDSLITWRQTLTEIIRRGGGNNFTFSNNFTQTYNLEPFDDTPISAVRFTITVGEDSLGDTDWLRHDVSADFARVTLRDGTFSEVSLNEGTTWPSRTTHSVDVPVAAGTTWGAVASVRVQHNAAGNDWNADNWTMNEIIIASIESDGSASEQYRRADTPVWQFRKNDRQIWQHDFT
jgi:hypothetical protein